MNKRIFANRFGLIALMFLSLFASTHAFAAAAQGTQQVVVTNTPAQPVPVVGITKDSDAPARKPFQTAYISVSVAAQGSTSQHVTSVPATQRLVIEYASAWCLNTNAATILLSSGTGTPLIPNGGLFLPRVLGTEISVPVRLYVNPSEDLEVVVNNHDVQSGACYITLSGYYVNLP